MSEVRNLIMIEKKKVVDIHLDQEMIEELQVRTVDQALDPDHVMTDKNTNIPLVISVIIVRGTLAPVLGPEKGIIGLGMTDKWRRGTKAQTSFLVTG